MGSTHPLPTPDSQDPSIQHWENGLVLYSNFITPQEESEIIASIQKDDRWCGIGKRQTMHYGTHFDYTTFCASDAWTDVPDWIEKLVGRLPFRETGGVDQFTVQYYPPGTGIPPHVDTHSAFGEYLYSLSLGSAVPMGFKRCGVNEERKMRRPKRSLGEVSGDVRRKAEEDGEEKWEVWLRERSLLVMRGEARYGFAHGIRGRKFDVDVELDENGEGVKRRREGRWSITMRSVKRGKAMGCECAFPGVCDARIREEREREEREKEREFQETGDCIPEVTSK